MHYLLLFICFVLPLNGFAQSNEPRNAFLKSLVLPGWGHSSLGEEYQKTRRWHYGVEVGLIVGYISLNSYAQRLQQNAFTFARSQAGVDLSNRSRAFRLSVSRYNSLTEYNQEMLRVRNWEAILPETAENSWQWSSAEARATYNQRRSNVDQVKQQLPAIIGLMTLHRLVSSISAYQATRKRSASPISFSLNPYWQPELQQMQWQAGVRYSF